MSYTIAGGRVVYRMYGVRHEQSCDADTATFQPLGEEYGKDARRVYFQGAPIEHAEPATFEPLGRFHGRDARRVFWRSRVIDRASPSSFDALGGDYGRDGSVVFDCVAEVAGADAATFEVLDEAHARDRHRVYRYGKVVPDVAPHDLVVWGPYARVGSTCSHRGSDIAGADAPTFRGLEGSDYAVDARQAYYAGAPIHAADLTTFVVRGLALASDDARGYVGGTPYKGPIEQGWASLDLPALEAAVVARRYASAALSGDATAMVSLARHALATDDPFRALVWARLAQLFGRKRLSRLEADAQRELDPHEEIPELVPEVAHAVAEMLWRGVEVPRKPELAQTQLTSALRERLTELVDVTRTSLVETFGAECVAAAEAAASAPPARKSDRKPRR